MILGIYHVNINVSNLDRSVAFYEGLGFKVLHRFNEVGNQNVDRGLGLTYSNSRAVFMGLGISRHETVLDLVQWLEPASAVAPRNVLDLGMPRLCLRVKDLDGEIAKLEKRGVEFFSDPQILDHLERRPRYVLFKDPDGVILEMVEFTLKRKAGKAGASSEQPA